MKKVPVNQIQSKSASAGIVANSPGSGKMRDSRNVASFRRLLFAIRFDIVFQFRHGFYYAYLFVCLLYICLLRAIPAHFKEISTVLVIFSDPDVLGFFFIGGIVLLERSQNILENLFITPLRLNEYLLAKVVSLGILSVVTSYFILLSTFGLAFNPLPILVGVFLSSAFFTLLGLTLAVRARTLNGFLLTSPLYILPFYLPILGYVQLFDTPLFYILPGKGSLLFMHGAFHRVNFWQSIYGVCILTVWAVLAFIWAHHNFYQRQILKIGGRT